LLRRERNKFKNFFDVLNSATSENSNVALFKTSKKFFNLFIFFFVFEKKKKKFDVLNSATLENSDVALFKTSKKLIIKFFDVLVFITSKNFDVAFLTKALKRQKVAFFFVVIACIGWITPQKNRETSSQEN
jgi:hypothetical protein